jgi:hypothetical protein
MEAVEARLKKIEEVLQDNDNENEELIKVIKSFNVMYLYYLNL